MSGLNPDAPEFQSQWTTRSNAAPEWSTERFSTGTPRIERVFARDNNLSGSAGKKRARSNLEKKLDFGTATSSQSAEETKKVGDDQLKEAASGSNTSGTSATSGASGSNTAPRISHFSSPNPSPEESPLASEDDRDVLPDQRRSTQIACETTTGLILDEKVANNTLKDEVVDQLIRIVGRPALDGEEVEEDTEEPEIKVVGTCGGTEEGEPEIKVVGQLGLAPYGRNSAPAASAAGSSWWNEDEGVAVKLVGRGSLGANKTPERKGCEGSPGIRPPPGLEL